MFFQKQSHEKSRASMQVANRVMQQEIDAAMEEMKPKLKEDMDELGLSEDERDQYVRGIRQKLELESIRIFKELAAERKMSGSNCKSELA